MAVVVVLVAGQHSIAIDMSDTLVERMYDFGLSVAAHPRNVGTVAGLTRMSERLAAVLTLTDRPEVVDVPCRDRIPTASQGWMTPSAAARRGLLSRRTARTGSSSRRPQRSRGLRRRRRRARDTEVQEADIRAVIAPVADRSGRSVAA